MGTEIVIISVVCNLLDQVWHKDSERGDLPMHTDVVDFFQYPAGKVEVTKARLNM